MFCLEDEGIVYRVVEANFSDLTGKVVKEIKGLAKYSEWVIIVTDEGEYIFLPDSSVSLEDFEMSAVSLDGGLITIAEEVEEERDCQQKGVSSWTWMFYKIETNKGSLWMRWLGTSYGYVYCEVCSFYKVVSKCGALKHDADTAALSKKLSKRYEDDANKLRESQRKALGLS